MDKKASNYFTTISKYLLLVVMEYIPAFEIPKFRQLNKRLLALTQSDDQFHMV